jgi:H+/Cl- antiporter ClcA
MHLQTAWFGALGGVTIAIYGIYEHIQKRDFDPKYELWYFCKPIIGGIFGWFVWLIFLVGLISVQGIGETELKHPELPFVIAFLAGFSERFTLKMIDKLMNVLTSFEEKPAEDTSKKEATK